MRSIWRRKESINNF